jgi:hypothetical protein
MLPNAKISEQAAVLATIDPISQGVGTAVSGWLSAANFERFLATIDVGVFGASATVDAKLQQATTSGGAGAKDITGKSITQLLAAGGNNRQALINLRASELDLANSFNYFQLSVTVGTAATLIAANVLGGVAKNMPASALNQAGVAQIVA